MPLFTFSLDYFDITDTRSLHEDTDYLSFTLAVNGVPQTLVKSMGDLNNGVHTVNLSFNDVSVDPTDSVVLNYLIVNSGLSERVVVETTLENVGANLVVAGASLGVPQLSSALKVLGNWLANHFENIVNSAGGCDGPVAAEQDTFTGTDLANLTANGTFTQNTRHPGLDSHFGCGGNSVYFVKWRVIDLSVSSQIVPNVFELSEADATSEVEAAGLVPSFKTATHSTAKPHIPIAKQAWVFSQSPAAGSMVTAGSTVTMVLHTGIEP